jgi:hypothetical protein
MTALTDVIDAARRVVDGSSIDLETGASVADYDRMSKLQDALKAYDAGVAESLPTFKKDGWSMKFEDCGPNDPGAFQCTNAGVAPSWMRRVE